MVRSSNGAVSVDRAGASVDLEISTAEGTAARLAVNGGHGHVRNLLDSAARPGEADETIEVRGRTSYGDITIHRS